jgi:hypothetical protein
MTGSRRRRLRGGRELAGRGLPAWLQTPPWPTAADQRPEERAIRHRTQGDRRLPEQQPGQHDHGAHRHHEWPPPLFALDQHPGRRRSQHPRRQQPQQRSTTSTGDGDQVPSARCLIPTIAVRCITNWMGPWMRPISELPRDRITSRVLCWSRGSTMNAQVLRGRPAARSASESLTPPRTSARPGSNSATGLEGAYRAILITRSPTRSGCWNCGRIRSVLAGRNQSGGGSPASRSCTARRGPAPAALPGPDLLGGPLDGDRVGPDAARPGQQPVARSGGLVLLVGGAPLIDPRSRHHRVECPRGREQRTEGQDPVPPPWPDRACHGRLPCPATASMVPAWTA